MSTRHGILASTLLLLALLVACGGNAEHPYGAATVTGRGSPPITSSPTGPTTRPSPTTTLSPLVPTTTPTAAEPSAVASVLIDDFHVNSTVPNSDIAALATDGSSPRQLTDDPRPDGSPRWSPDGRQLAFASWRVDGGGLFVMDADGRNVRQLAAIAGAGLAWSPDGRQLAVAGVTRTDYAQIYLVAVDGSGQQRLTSAELMPMPALSQGNSWPAWSPDGRQIVFIGQQSDGLSQVYVINVDGSHLQQVTTSPDRKSGKVAWSADGGLLAFATDAADADIWLVRPDGSELHNLTASPAVEIEFAWSPVTQELAFTRQVDAAIQLVVANADGSGERVIYDSPEFVMQLCWSPDGQQLAFIRGNPERNSDLFVINADGSGLQQLTSTPDSETDPAWSPDGTTIVYAAELEDGEPDK